MNTCKILQLLNRSNVGRRYGTAGTSQLRVNDRSYIMEQNCVLIDAVTKMPKASRTFDEAFWRSLYSSMTKEQLGVVTDGWLAIIEALDKGIEERTLSRVEVVRTGEYLRDDRAASSQLKRRHRHAAELSDAPPAENM